MEQADKGLRRYEGLVHVTARMYAKSCGMEPDDLAQLLWLKIWQTRSKFDPRRSGLPEERYVYGCVKNRVKDLIRDYVRQCRREGPPSLPMAVGESDADMWVGGMVVYRERFEERYLSTGSDEVFGEIEEGPFVLPATITQEEAQVIVLLMRGYTQKDIAEAMALPRKRVKRHQEAIEAKLCDWAPAVGAGRESSPERLPAAA